MDFYSNLLSSSATTIVSILRDTPDQILMSSPFGEEDSQPKPTLPQTSWKGGARPKEPSIKENRKPDEIAADHRTKIFECLNNLNDERYSEILTECSEKDQWRDLFDLLKQRRKKKNNNMNGLAANICLSGFIKSDSFDIERMEILIKCGASVEAIKESMPPIRAAAQLGHVPAIRCLMKHGCDYQKLRTQKGDTYLHAALRICISKGNFDLLEHFLDEKIYPHVNPNIRDSHGNTLFHVVTSEKFNKQVLRAAKILLESSVNPNLLNEDGKSAIACLQKEDERRHVLNLTAGKFEKPPVEATNSESNVTQTDQEISVETTETSPSKNSAKQSLARIKLAIQKWVDSLPDQIESCDFDPLRKIDPDEDSEEEKEVQDKYWSTTSSYAGRVDETTDAGKKNCTSGSTVGDLRSTPSPTVDEDEYRSNYDIATDNFDGLEWEVECTPEVWKKLYNKCMDMNLKEIIINKIKMLATGNWRSNLVHKIKQVPNDVRLYRVKIPGGRSFIWELAVAFSPRLNDTCIESDDATIATDHSKIYSEIIRIWDIILDNKDYQKILKQIIQSHKRGQDSFLQKRLKSSKRMNYQVSGEDKRLPKLFLEEGAIDIPSTALTLSPLACPSEAEYQIMKFYSFNTSLINTILHNQGIKVDFPFRVTDVEHNIINLQPLPPCPILLVGRSGTGKTTCLLYRLWSRFERYWQHAIISGPWIPRHSKYELLPIENDEESDNKDKSSDDEKNDEGGNGDNDMCYQDATSECLDPAAESIINTEPIYEHIHQIFITKNAVLCTEVQKNFRELTHASEVTQARVAVENIPLPNRIQDIHADAFPLFLSSKEFLLLLDASLPGKPFFPRNEDGSLNCEIKGWRGEEAPMSFIPDIDIESDSDDEQDEIDVQLSSKKKVKSAVREWREVTYEVFAHELWPLINKGGKYRCYPTLVWMEINSFIKGSATAMKNRTGFLTLEEYLKLGNKQAPNFSGRRNDVYKMFKNYQHVVCQSGYFDECDVVHNVFYRLDSMTNLDWSLHEFYVDETQDFTQAELCLLIRCCQSPNDMFLTGDTAQSIMRGVSFRFSDLKSLYFFAHESLKVIGKEAAIGVPRRIHQLTHNYRSHAGILALATSVVDLMEYFFPDSFDHLAKDQGLFSGPKPVLLTSCCEKDLALLLCDHKRDTTHIEFGAHQTILVANDEARKNLPKELRHGLVLTVFESKGLEFDDVLLYNFFKDSQAQNEWRVVRTFLDELMKKQKQKQGKDINENLKVIALDVLQRRDASRPLNFDPEKHKVLNSELKYLYTALTRARVNVWIFDESEELRKPMFEYFQALGLVTSVDVPDDKVSSDNLFAKQSTTTEWKKRGDDFYRKRMFEPAATCYGKADRPMLENYCLAHHHAMEAGSLRSEPHKMRFSFLKAAELYLNCERFEEAAKCLYIAKQFQASAILSEKLGKFYAAGVGYKKANDIMSAAKAFERCSRYKEAVDLLGSGLTYELAIDIVERFNNMIKKNYDIHPQTTRPVHTVKELCLKAASFYIKQHKKVDALDALKRGLEDRHKEIVAFLTREGQYLMAADYLGQQDKLLDAAQLLRKSGKLEEAMKILEKFQPQNDRDKCIIAECFLTFARKEMARRKFQLPKLDEGESSTVVNDVVQPSTPVGQKGSIDSPSESKSTSRSKLKRQKFVQRVLSLIEKAGKLYTSAQMVELTSSNIANVAECEMYKGFFSSSSDILVKACEKFLKINNAIGALECLDLLGKSKDDAFFSLERCTELVIPCIEKLKILLPLFFGKAKTNLEKDMLAQCELFYGLDMIGEDLIIKEEEGARISHLFVKKNSENIETSVCLSIILADVIQKVTPIILQCVDVFREEFSNNASCHRTKVGYECDYVDCKKRHEPNVRVHYFKQITSSVNLITIYSFVGLLFDCIRSAKKSATQHNLECIADARVLLTDSTLHGADGLRKSCKRLMHVIFPTHRQELHMSDFYAQAKELITFIKKVSDDLVKQVEERWNRASPEKKVASIELYMEMQKMLQIAGRLDLMGSFLKEAETMENPPTTRGFFRVKTGDEYHDVSYFRLYMISKRTLHEERFPFRSVGNINEFLMKIAKKADTIMIPTFADTMLLLEYQITVCFAMLLRSSEGSHVFLPPDYLAQVQLMDAMYASQFEKSLYYVVHYQKDEFNHWRRIQGLVNQIEKFFYGGISDNFNILSEAFSNEDYIESGEAERVLVFALVLLVNLDINGPVQISHEKILMQRIAAIRCDPATTPRRLLTGVNAVKNAQGWRDFSLALVQLLQARGNEYLYKCYWVWDHRQKDKNGIHYHPVDKRVWMRPNVFSSANQSRYAVDESYTEQDSTGKMTSDEFKSIIKDNLAFKEKKYEEPVDDELAELKEAPKSMTDSLFPSNPIDESMCNICNVHFALQSQKMQPDIEVDDNVEASHDASLGNKGESFIGKHTTPVYKSVANIFSPGKEQSFVQSDTQVGDYSEELTTVSLRAAHESSEEHGRNTAIYRECKSFIQQSIEPIFSVVAMTFGKGRQAYDDTSYAREWQESLEDLQKAEKQANNDILEFVKSKEWINYKNLKHTYQQLLDSLNLTRKIDQEAQSSKGNEADEAEDPTTGLTDDIDDD